MSRLAEVLAGLREQAWADRGEWQEFVAPHGLRLAWRVKEVDGEELDFLAMQRDGMVPPLNEQRTVIEHGLPGIAPVSRTHHPKKGIVMLVLREYACPGCGRDLEPQAKMQIRTHCLMCTQEGERACHRCGAAVSGAKGTDLHRCGKCRREMEGR